MLLGAVPLEAMHRIVHPLHQPPCSGEGVGQANRRLDAMRPAEEGMTHDKTTARKAANASHSHGQTQK
jgi:hypothetical protein